jgi:hypothetical protein
VHVYEWDLEDLTAVLIENGFEILDCIGLLPGAPTTSRAALVARFGDAAGAWYDEVAVRVPSEFLAPILAATIPEASREVLLVCRKRYSE